MVAYFQLGYYLLKLTIFHNVILGCLTKEGFWVFFFNFLKTVTWKACQFLSVIHIFESLASKYRIKNTHSECLPQLANTLSVGKLLRRGK